MYLTQPGMTANGNAPNAFQGTCLRGHSSKIQSVWELCIPFSNCLAIILLVGGILYESACELLLADAHLQITKLIDDLFPIPCVCVCVWVLKKTHWWINSSTSMLWRFNSKQNDSCWKHSHKLLYTVSHSHSAGWLSPIGDISHCRSLTWLAMNRELRYHLMTRSLHLSK